MDVQRAAKSKKHSASPGGNGSSNGNANGNGNKPPKTQAALSSSPSQHQQVNCGIGITPIFNKNGRKLKGPEDYAAAHPEDLEVRVITPKVKRDPDEEGAAIIDRVLFCRFCQSEVTSKSNRISEHLQSVRHNRFKQGIQSGETWNTLAAMYGAHSSSKLAAANGNGNLQLDAKVLAGHGNGNGNGNGSGNGNANGNGPSNLSRSAASSPTSSSNAQASTSLSGNGSTRKPQMPKNMVVGSKSNSLSHVHSQSQSHLNLSLNAVSRALNGSHGDAKQRRIDQFAFDLVQTSAYLGVSTGTIDKDKSTLLNALTKYAPNCIPRSNKLDFEEMSHRFLPSIFARHVDEVQLRLKTHLISITVDDHDGQSNDYASNNADIYATVYDAVADEQRVYLLWSLTLPLAQPATHAAETLLETVECVLRLYDCDTAQIVALVTSCSPVTRHFAEIFVRKRPFCLHVPNIRALLQRTIYRALTCETELELVFNLVKQTEQCFRHAVGVRQAYLEACVTAGISPENVGVCWNVDGARWQSWFSAARSIHKSWSFLSAFLETIGAEQLAAGACYSGEFTAKQFSELKACFTADEHRDLIYLLLTAVIDALEPFRDVAQYLDEDVDLPFKVAYLLNTKLKRAADLPLSDRVLCMINVLSRTKQERVLRIVNQFRSSLCVSLEQEIERASVSSNVFAVGGFFERCAAFDPVFKTLAQYSAEQNAQLLATFEPYFVLLTEFAGYVLPSANQEFCEYVFSHPVQQGVVSLTQFWKSNTRKYPHLSKLALQLAAIPVTTPLSKDQTAAAEAQKDRSNSLLFSSPSLAVMLAPLLKHTRDPESVIVRCMHANMAVFIESQKRTNPIGTAANVHVNVNAIGPASVSAPGPGPGSGSAAAFGVGVGVGVGLLSALEDMSKLCAVNLSVARSEVPIKTLPQPPQLQLQPQAQAQASVDQSNMGALNLTITNSTSVTKDTSDSEPTPKRKRTRSPSLMPSPSPSPSSACNSPSNSSASNSNSNSVSDQADLIKSESELKPQRSDVGAMIAS